jgi:hypothetical protein
MLAFLPPEITAAGTTILPRRFKLYHYRLRRGSWSRSDWLLSFFEPLLAGMEAAQGLLERCCELGWRCSFFEGNGLAYAHFEAA